MGRGGGCALRFLERGRWKWVGSWSVGSRCGARGVCPGRAGRTLGWTFWKL